MTAIYMKCGCAAQGTATRAGAQVPVCITHDCLDPAEPPNLIGRQAQCAYGFHAIVPSEITLPFFEYQGAGSPRALKICKCGYAEVAHLPRWRVTIKITRRWYAIPEYVDILTRETHAADEAGARSWGEQFAAGRLNQKQPETKVQSAVVEGAAQVQSPLRCKAFVARGPEQYDKYYCGCRGWD